MRLPRKQRGFLLIVAVVLIAVAATMAVAIVTLTTGSSQGGGRHLLSTQALFLAETGLERATSRLLAPEIGNRATCAAVALSAISVGPVGQYQIALSNPPATQPTYPTTVDLAAAISTSTTTPIEYLRVDTTTGLAPSGRVMIDREMFDYESLGTIDADCGGVGTAPCLRNVARARDGSTAAQHANGTRVAQYQCTVTATGGAPDLATNARGQRTLEMGVQLQEGWVVGNRERDLANNFTMGRWNRPTETQWNAAFLAGNNNTRADLNAISMSSYADGWAVGNSRGGNFILMRFAPTTDWTVQTVAPNPAGDDQNLNGVSCVSMNDCWAVGDRRDGTCGGGGNPKLHTILRWNGAWTVLTTATAPSVPACSGNNETLNDVFAVSASEVWAVGNRYTGGCGGGGSRRPTIMRWITGGNWTLLTNSTIPSVPGCDTSNEHLNALYMLDTDGDGDADDGWAVGDRDANNPTGWTFFRYTGATSSWARVVVTTAGTNALNLNSVYMISATDGWAVGNGGVILRWNNPTAGTWNINAVPGAVTTLDLNAVACFTADDCWAAGDSFNPQTDPPVMLHWNGSGWAAVAAPAGFDEHLNGFSLVGARTRPSAAWREVFP